jgi:uncharacterized protein YqcC (DUF446 family)
MSPTPEDAARHADAIEAELRALGWWDIPEPEPERLVDAGAFGQRSLAFAEWLRWVLVPRLRQVAAGEVPWPSSSQVGAYAVRELDGVDEASALIDALIALDAAA